MARSIVITKRTNGGIKCVRDGVMTNNYSSLGYYTLEEGSETGIILQNKKGDNYFDVPYPPDSWTVEGVTGFTTIEEVCNALDAAFGSFFFSVASEGSVLPSDFRFVSTTGGLRLDKKLTVIGFAGVENTDWETINIFN